MFQSLQYISELETNHHQTNAIPCFTDVVPPGFLPTMDEVIHSSETRAEAEQTVAPSGVSRTRVLPSRTAER